MPEAAGAPPTTRQRMPVGAAARGGTEKSTGAASVTSRGEEAAAAGAIRAKKGRRLSLPSACVALAVASARCGAGFPASPACMALCTRLLTPACCLVSSSVRWAR